jgi:type I restriction enzyme S subunit
MSKQAKLDAFMKKDINNIEDDEEKVQRPYDLPEGWKWTTLKELIVKGPQYGLTAKSEKEGRILYIRITDVDSLGRLISTDLHYVNIDEETFEKYAIKPGDILIARSGATAGKAFLCKEPMNAVFGSYLLRFRVDERKVLPNYLFYFLLSNEYWDQVKSWKIGGAQPNVNAQNLKKLKVPLPPLEEQKRIVSRLDQLVSRAEEAKRLRKLAKEEAEKIMHAALNKVFSKAEEEGWERVKIGKIVSLQKGKKPSKLFNEKIEGSVPYLTAQYMRGLEEPEYCLKTDDIILTEEKDVLIIMDGSYSGDVFIGFNGALASTMAKFLLNKSIILPEYLYYFLKNNFEILNTKTKGAAIPHVRKDVLFNLQVPLPPFEEQKRIIVYLDKFRETIESIRELQQKTEEELEKFVPSILDKAFRGEL